MVANYSDAIYQRMKQVVRDSPCAIIVEIYDPGKIEYLLGMVSRRVRKLMNEAKSIDEMSEAVDAYKTLRACTMLVSKEVAQNFIDVDPMTYES